nr:ABC transporter substrate-binding protein [Phytoactinopolyspora limicola]
MGVPLGYDSLIYEAPDGSLQPQIAEEWGYVGDGNETFEIRLRSGLSFTDGEPVNAEAVKVNIDYRLDPAAGSQSAAFLGSVTDVELVDDLTLRVHVSEPDPLMPAIFTQHWGGPGILISPAALEDPGVLATGTFGVGRYMIDPGRTVMGDHYTWIPDPNYWDQDAIFWDEIVIHHMPELSAALAALQSGQIDLMRADATIIEAGQAAGFAVEGPGMPIVQGFALIDRDGETEPALGDVRVRQGLNYAIDREKIARALFGDLGMPTDQMSAPSRSGWNDEPFYPYDPDRAAQLFAEAGYGEGFSFRVRIPPDDAFTRLTEAVADDLRKVGVELQVDAVPGNQFDQGDGSTNREYGAILMGWGIHPPFRMGRSWWLPNSPNNAFGTVDEQLVELDEELAIADAEVQEELDQRIISRVAELAWFLPIVIFGEAVLYDDQVVNLPWTDFASFPWPTEFRPAVE